MTDPDVPFTDGIGELVHALLHPEPRPNTHIFNLVSEPARHSDPHLDDTGLCLCGCRECTSRIISACVCEDCRCDTMRDHAAYQWDG